jgi:anti-sigma regulatory factor (Ser/Thr protein kinase)
MDKFTSQIQIEDSADFQEWLDIQEVADIRAMESEQSEALSNVRAMAIEQGLSDEAIDEINLELSEGENNALI